MVIDSDASIVALREAQAARIRTELAGVVLLERDFERVLTCIREKKVRLQADLMTCRQSEAKA